ncbi:MAG TPA: hypothetical protein VLG36_00840 [Candidatus Chromulinivoraceae bacterium]|nr:hypothetical protein [Candidatus Chromulinivoraceae bacterium]
MSQSPQPKNVLSSNARRPAPGKAPLHFKIVLAVTLLCAYESLTKGWLTIILFPASMVILLLFVFLQFQASSRLAKTVPATIGLRTVQIGQIIAVLALYLGVVGFGDTHQVFLFGFLSIDLSSPLVGISSFIGWTGLALTIVFSGLLLISIVFGKRYGNRGVILGGALFLVVCTIFGITVYNDNNMPPVHYCDGKEISAEAALNCNGALQQVQPDTPQHPVIITPGLTR